MKMILICILFFCLVMFHLPANAQHHKIQSVDRKTQSKHTYSLPRMAYLKISGDEPNISNRVILDSLIYDSIYVSNPNRKEQSLTIAVSQISKIKIPKKPFLQGLKYVTTVISSIGALALLNVADNKHSSAALAASMVYAGIAIGVNIGPKRVYSPLDFLICSK